MKTIFDPHNFDWDEYKIGSLSSLALSQLKKLEEVEMARSEGAGDQNQEDERDLHLINLRTVQYEIQKRKTQIKVHDVQRLLLHLGCSERKMNFHSIFSHQKIPSPIVLPLMEHLTIQQLIHIRGLLIDNGFLTKVQWDLFVTTRTIPRPRR